jgi:hypothetical protein
LTRQKLAGGEWRVSERVVVMEHPTVLRRIAAIDVSPNFDERPWVFLISVYVLISLSLT